MRIARSSLVAICFAGCLGGGLFSPGALAQDGMQAAMGLIFESMRELLRLTTLDPALQGPDSGPLLLDATREIEDQANILSEHMVAHADAEFLADTLERSAFLIGRYYELGLVERIPPLVLQTTEICIACHTRGPSPSDSPAATDFLASTPAQAVEGRARALLQIAARRFDDGLDTLEALIRAPDTSTAELDSALLAYLVVSLRVKEDFARPIATLESLDARPGLAGELRARVALWLDALRTLRRGVPVGEALDVAQANVRNGARRETQAAGGGLIDYIVASGLLHRIAEASPSGPIAARVYYLLGLTEYRITGLSWLPQAELYLESAILAAPGTVTAGLAYELLARKVFETYAEEVGSAVPDEVVRHLEQLKQMASGA